MLRRRHITLLATILAFAAAIASGGGVARFVHMMVAHGGHSVCTTADAGCHTMHAHAHLVLKASATNASDTDATCDSSDAEHSPAAPSHDCAVCGELAVNLLAPTLLSFFSTSVEVLAIVHTREAAQLPAPHAPEAVAARPPPFFA